MIDLQPINETFVADITGLDVRYLADTEFDEIYAAWLRFGVLRLRNQPIDEYSLQAFSARFGPLEEIPAEGGDTYFADQAAAYAALPAALKNRIQDLTIKHDAAHTSTGELRAGFEAFDDPRDAPGAIHSMVLRHDETGSAALYLGRREWAYIPGWPLDESESLLDEIWSYATCPEFVWQQRWQPGDLIIWDNRRVLHRRDNFDPQLRRLMKRCQVIARSQTRTTKP